MLQWLSNFLLAMAKRQPNSNHIDNNTRVGYLNGYCCRSIEYTCLRLQKHTKLMANIGEKRDDRSTHT